MYPMMPPAPPAPPAQALCPHCGQPMPASTPAQPAPPAQMSAAPVKQNQSWRDKPPLL